MNKYPQPNRDSENGQNRNGKTKDKFVRTNWKIKAGECRVIEEGKPPTVMPTRDAIEYAQKLDMDLVEINYDYRTNTSTCKVCDYGKFVYEQKRREKEAKKQARANLVEIKTLQISLTTDTADMNRVISRAKEFLAAGDKVKLVLRFRGRRELSNIELGRGVMKTLLSNFEGLAVMDSPPSLNGKELSCVLRRSQPGASIKITTK